MIEQWIKSSKPSPHKRDKILARDENEQEDIDQAIQELIDQGFAMNEAKDAINSSINDKDIV